MLYNKNNSIGGFFMSQDITIKVKNEGAELTSINFKGRECLHQSDEVWKSQAPILFPTIGASFEDSIIIKGEKYTQKHHGFIRNTHFRKFVEEPNYYAFRFLSNSETKLVYPYDFDMEVTYSVFENILSSNVKVTNSSNEAIPFMIGFHPGFTLLPNTEFEEYSLVFENNEDETSVLRSVGALLPLFKGNTINLSKCLLNFDAIVLKDLKSKKVSLFYKEEKVFTFEFASRFLGIWTRPETDNKFICLEPWYSLPDKEYNEEFTDRITLNLLKPLCMKNFGYRVQFFK